MVCGVLSARAMRVGGMRLRLSFWHCQPQKMAAGRGFLGDIAAFDRTGLRPQETRVTHAFVADTKPDLQLVWPVQRTRPPSHYVSAQAFVRPRLGLGSQDVAADLSALRNGRITHVLNVGHGVGHLIVIERMTDRHNNRRILAKSLAWLSTTAASPSENHCHNL